MFEVDGKKSKVYCQNLCLLSKLFLVCWHGCNVLGLLGFCASLCRWDALR